MFSKLFGDLKHLVYIFSRKKYTHYTGHFCATYGDTSQVFKLNTVILLKCKDSGMKIQTIVVVEY